jgi:kynurenine formamidase
VWRRSCCATARARDAFYAELDHMARGPGVTADATRWLFEQGVRVMGIDAWVLD